MTAQRRSDIELLRIVLILTVPAYHLVLYSGILTDEPTVNTIFGLILSSGGAIAADYAFIAISAYFMLEGKPREIIASLTRTVVTVAVLYVVRWLIVRSMFPYDPNNFVIEEMVLKGAWWFIYQYMLLILMYPFLNWIVHKFSKKALLALCIVLAGVLVVMNMINITTPVGNLVMFDFTYLSVGYLKQKGYPCHRVKLVLAYLLCYGLVLGICLAVKFGNICPAGTATQIVLRLTGKYQILQYVMGMSLFFLFRTFHIGVRPRINRMAGCVMYIFLLHETVMAIFRYFGKLTYTLQTVSAAAFWGWLVLYTAICFVTALAVEWVFQKFLAVPVRRLSQWIASLPPVSKTEKWYLRITEVR